MALPWHHSVFHGNMNKPPIHKAYHTITFDEQPKFLSLNICKGK